MIDRVAHDAGQIAPVNKFEAYGNWEIRKKSIRVIIQALAEVIAVLSKPFAKLRRQLIIQCLLYIDSLAAIDVVHIFAQRVVCHEVLHT